MQTVADIVGAVKELSVAEKRELLTRLAPILVEPGVLPDEVDDPRLSRDFTERLVQHFHRAKRAALAQTK